MIKERSSVVITGGASGIGKALAFRFGKEGHDIIIGDVEEAALEIAISELRSEAILATGIVVDVSDLCLLYTSPSPRDMRRSRMPSSA